MSEVYKLGISINNNQPINEVNSIDVINNQGVVGDRHFKEFNDPYNQLSLIESENIDYYNERKYKIGFFMSAPFETCTNSWSVMEEIMLELSFQENIAMVAKFHPRLYKLGDYRYLKKIDNLKLYGPELDRNRLTKWADIIICSDHCSMLFEGMIFQKKVVAIHSKKVRPFAKFESKIHGCDISMNSIYSASELKLDELAKEIDA